MLIAPSFGKSDFFALLFSRPPTEKGNMSTSTEDPRIHTDERFTVLDFWLSVPPKVAKKLTIICHSVTANATLDTCGQDFSSSYPNTICQKIDLAARIAAKTGPLNPRKVEEQLDQLATDQPRGDAKADYLNAARVVAEAIAPAKVILRDDEAVAKVIIDLSKDIQNDWEKRLRAEEKQRQRDARNARQKAELEATGLPSIETNNRQQREVMDEMVKAFARVNYQKPTLFNGPIGLVCIGMNNSDPPSPIIETVTREGLQNHAANAANWTSSTIREGIKNISPPRDLCANFGASSQNWKGLPPLDGIVTAPFFEASGKLCAAPGYHRKSRNYLHLPRGFELPDTTPTPANLAAAKNLIFNTLLTDVAFADQSSRANAVALMIERFVRRMIANTQGKMDDTPLYLWDAPTQKSGKTVGATICVSAFGDPYFMTEKGETDDAEWRKAIVSLLAQGVSNILIDNVTGGLSSPTFAAALTTPALTERILGSMRNVTVSTRITWVATSNNAQLSTDAASRAVMVRLDTNLEKPEARDFKLDPIEYIKANRAAVQGAIITLVNHWQAEGSPEFTERLHATRFKTWARIMGGILGANEIEGFLLNAETVQSQLDPDTEAWTAFIAAWAKDFPTGSITAARLVPLAVECELLPNTKEDLGQRMGKMLQAKKDRVFGGFKISKSPEQSRVVNWYLESVPQPKTP